MTSPFPMKPEPVSFSIYPNCEDDCTPYQSSKDAETSWDSPIQEYQTIDPKDIENTNAKFIIYYNYQWFRHIKTENVNSHFIDELLEWYGGRTIRTNIHPQGTRVRLALFINAYDIPAARKTSGFTSHASLCACYKCAHQFSVFPGTTNIDYSGFDLENWELRTWENNRIFAEQW
ncbi:hypothetical protein INT45_004427, partial [Circinella minor]